MLINFDKIQTKYSWLKIPNLMFYVVLFSAILYLSGFVLIMSSRSVLISAALNFDKNLILKGEFWRVITYVFLTPRINIFMTFLYLYVLNFVGNSLETYWGAVNFTLYYVLGVVLTTAAGFLVGTVNIIFFNLSLVFICATIYPDINLHVFSFVNIKMYWLGIVVAVLFLTKLVISIIIWNPANLMSEGVAVFMFMLFFGPQYFINMFNNLKMLMNRSRF